MESNAGVGAEPEPAQHIKPLAEREARPCAQSHSLVTQKDGAVWAVRTQIARRKTRTGD